MKNVLRLPLFVLVAACTADPADCTAQSREFGHFVRLGTDKTIWVKPPAAKKVKWVVPAGTVIRRQQMTSYTAPDGTSKVEDAGNRTYTLKADSTVFAKADAPDDLDSFFPAVNYRANAVQSKDTVYINYQLFPLPAAPPAKRVKSPAATKGPAEAQTGPKRIRNPKYEDELKVYQRNERLAFREPPAEEKEKMLAPSTHSNSGKDVYFDRRNTYFIKLHDRQALSFTTTAIELAALTVPFQYRPGYTKGGKQARGQLNVDANLGAYMGLKLGRVTYRYRKHETLTPNKYSFSVGPFLSLSRVALDSTNTRLAKDRKNIYRSIASLSTGGALMMDLQDFRVGLFVAHDIAIGSKQWDFNRRFWFGLGLGYKLAILSASK